MARNISFDGAKFQEFGKMMRVEIENAGLSQADICAKIGFDKSNLSNFLYGRKAPGAQSVLAIAEALPLPACRRVILFYTRTIACDIFQKHIVIEACPHGRD